MRSTAFIFALVWALAACGSGRIDVPTTATSGASDGTNAGGATAGTGNTGDGGSGNGGAGATPADGSAPAGASLGSTLGPGANANLKGFSDFIADASAQTNVPADLIAAVIWRESRADATVAGGGLMQVDPQAFLQMQQQHPALAGKDLSDPQTAILAGAYYIVLNQQTMQTKYNRNDWGITLRAYNSGVNGVDPSNLNATPAGTGDPNYVTAVMGYWVIISTGQGSLPP